jgi:hypothetical protein
MGKILNLLQGFKQVYKQRNVDVLFSQMLIITAWQCITPEVIVKGSKLFYLSNAVDETDVVEWQ